MSFRYVILLFLVFFPLIHVQCNAVSSTQELEEELIVEPSNDRYIFPSAQIIEAELNANPATSDDWNVERGLNKIMTEQFANRKLVMAGIDIGILFAMRDFVKRVPIDALEIEILKMIYKEALLKLPKWQENTLLSEL